MTMRAHVGWRAVPIVEVVGPRLDDKGGVSTVIRNYGVAGLFKDDADSIRVRFFGSTRDGPTSFRALYGAWRFVLFASRLWGFPDIVHLHTSWRGSCVRKALYAWVAHLRGAQIVFHIHPSRFYDFVDQQAAWFRRAFYATLRRANAIIVLTPQMKSLTECRAPRIPVHVMSNPVDPSLFGPSDAVVRDLAHVAFLGRFEEQKGLFDLFAAIRGLHDRGVDVRLTLAGGKDEGGVVAALERFDLSGVVSVRGWLGAPAVAELLRQCTLLVLPSYSEGLPMVLLESMMCGTPIVSCPVGGVPLIVKDERNGLLVPPGDIPALEKAINRLLSSPELCHEISMNNIADATEFRGEAIVRDLRVLYRKLAATIGPF